MPISPTYRTEASSNGSTCSWKYSTSPASRIFAAMIRLTPRLVGRQRCLPGPLVRGEATEEEQEVAIPGAGWEVLRAHAVMDDGGDRRRTAGGMVVRDRDQRGARHSPFVDRVDLGGEGPVVGGDHLTSAPSLPIAAKDRVVMDDVEVRHAFVGVDQVMQLDHRLSHEVRS